MEFTAREDIEAPIDFVFEVATDFATFERSIMRRGGDVQRLQGNDEAAVGTKWHVKFRLRGKDREVDAEIVEVDAPSDMTIEVTSPNFDGTFVMELVALSRARTRLHVKASANAKTIPAKLLFQSVRLARAKVESRFKRLVAGFAEDCETRYSA